MNITRKSGFTLVELLVVVFVVALLAALSFSAVTRMVAKGKASKAMSNLRQIGPLFGLYATDHNMSLPPCKAPVTQADGTTKERQWHELLLAVLQPETNPDDFRTKNWWELNDTFFRNPLLKETAKPRGWTPLNPGYGYNEMIPENLAIASTGTAPSHDQLQTVITPLASLAEPSRTPLIAPCDNYFYRYDPDELKGFETGTLKDLLSEGKFPVLFVDGHVEPISPAEYQTRQLYLVPIVPAS